MRPITLCLVAGLAYVAQTPVKAGAESPRETLIKASFADRTKASALAHVAAARQALAARLKAAPNDREAALMRATATGYYAKLTGSRSEAIAARKAFEALVAENPRDPEANLALGAWHLAAVNKLGRIVGRAAVGAHKAAGVAALERAVAQGGDRALVTGLSALLRLQLDPGDERGRALAEAAARGATPTMLDRIMRRAAALVLTPLRAGDARLTRATASRLLPFGQLPKES